MRLTLLVPLLFAAVLAGLPPAAGAQSGESPLDEGQLVELIGVMPDAGLASLISRRGINFKIGEEPIGRLQGAGAGPKTLTILRGFLSNSVPRVVLEAADAKLAPGGRLRLFARASDDDGDGLLYGWLSNNGQVSAEGPEAVLDASGIEAGGGQVLVTVSVTVSDRRGGFASDRLVVTVESPRPRPPVMAVEVVPDGKDFIVTLSGKALEVPGPVGSIEVSLDLSGRAGGVRKLTGLLPGVRCRLDFAGLSNIAQHSFVSTPRFDNEWGRVVVRIKVKDAKRAASFVIGWKVEAPSR